MSGTTTRNQVTNRDVRELADRVIKETRTEMFGLDEVIRLCLVALYSGGHVLLEGNPGLGKTALVRAIGKVLDLANGRIQFTPDLMPADITGTYVPNFKNNQPGEMVFQEGPIFTSLLLADEINRATPKTQSAMLEAMAESQVTVLGDRYELADPFMVLATQNPIDHEGTYDLPEAQSDRFMFKINLNAPPLAVLRQILGKTAGATSKKQPTPPSPENKPRVSPARPEYRHVCARIEAMIPLPSLETHIFNMILASNQQYDELVDLERREKARVRDLVDNLMLYGLGPRAATALMLGSKAYSMMFIEDADYALGSGLAHVVFPVLRHRIKLRFDWKTGYRKFADLDKKMDTGLLELMLRDFSLATAPQDYEYKRTFESELEKALAWESGRAGDPR